MLCTDVVALTTPFRAANVVPLRPIRRAMAHNRLSVFFMTILRLFLRCSRKLDFISATNIAKRIYESQAISPITRKILKVTESR
jgi:hypothetical protein